MNRNTPRYRDAFNWVRRCARANPGITCTAAIDDERLSCIIDQDGCLTSRTWQCFGAEIRCRSCGQVIPDWDDWFGGPCPSDQATGHDLDWPQIMLLKVTLEKTK